MVPIWLQPMENWRDFTRLKSSFEKKIGDMEIVGLSDAQKAHIVSSILYPIKSNHLFITYNDTQARQIYEDLKLFLGDKVAYFPAKDVSYYNIVARSKEIDAFRLGALNKLIAGEGVIIVASVEAILFYTIPPKIYKNSVFTLKIGDTISLHELTQKLISMGYERVGEVEGPGQFSQRGGIIDIFLLTYDTPFRLEFFDIEIDSIRKFDPISQLSTEKVDSVTISPCREFIISSEDVPGIIYRLENALDEYLEENDGLSLSVKDNIIKKTQEAIEKLKNHIIDDYIEMFFSYIYSEPATILDYLDGAVFFDEPHRIEEGYDIWIFEFNERFKHGLEQGEVLPHQLEVFLPYEQFLEIMDNSKKVVLRGLPRLDDHFRAKVVYNLSARSLPSYQGKLDMLVSDINFWKSKGYSIILLTGTKSRGRGISSALSEKGEELLLWDDMEGELLPGQIVAVPGSISKGFEYVDGKFVLISDREVYGFSKKKRKIKRRRQSIDPFTDLKIGDYVVHENHGIGRYLGIEKLTVGGQKRDYLNIQYSGSDTLYVPTDQVDNIQPYIGMGDGKPRISKLGSSDWQKTKAKARESVKELAYSLVELYAARQKMKGFKFSPDTDWQRQFEDMFPHVETEDQLQAIEEVKADMESDKVMDRLLCGDVGYGKTEVAIRAAFKAVMDGKQVAVLTPTTILAQQHYGTFSQRFEDFPFVVDVLSRFRTPTEQKNIIDNIRTGNVDIVIGTHRLLSKDVKFKDLGLLIIDEEQRFGVDHKETIKNIKRDVDVLTLTATPIPRTLHMSLVGIRDISIIETPPEERYPVETYVVEYTPALVKEVVMREVGRGGQVYFVYNKVKHIDWMAGELSRIMPDVSIGVAHGQMGERRLEKVMIDFYEGKYDVLLCSTIIESGLDIPNVNTVIVYDADHFGLSQLYQLRGRVGRSNRRAYAYLTYQRDKVLSEVAEKRLKTIREFTEFGAGFKIAMRDLEIRGTGNLLGPEQHGHMAAVGYDLYCKLLNEAIATAKGQQPKPDIEPTIDIKVDAYIDNSYIPHEAHKIEFYKKIAAIENSEDKFNVEDELIDRFGDMPREVQSLIDISYIRALAKRIGIGEISERNKAVIFKIVEGMKLSSKTIMIILNEYRKVLEYRSYPTPIFTLRMDNMNSNVILELIKEILERILQLQQG